jgi:hypothetical protein
MKATAKIKRPSIVFPSAVRRMDTLNDLLAASDLVSLHCVLTNETTHILNAERLQHIKPGKMVPSCFLFFLFSIFFFWASIMLSVTRILAYLYVPFFIL